MKKPKKQNHTKVALFAGAAAIMALTPNSHAQTSVDALKFTFTCYVNDLINNPLPPAKTGALHIMADLMWKF